MSKNISLLGADYPDVPAVVLPKTGGGNAMFVDADEINDFEDAIAIVIDGDIAPKAITSGQYLFIKNHSTLATGGYHATANISSGGTVSGSNVTADADGISNAINSKIAALNGKMTIQQSYTASNTTGFLKQILDYALTLGAGNYVMGVAWSQHFFCNVNVSVQSSSRAVASVFPQPANISEFYICEYNNGTYTYKKSTMSSL